MRLEILKIEDTEDGGAVVTVEVDRDMLHVALEQFINHAIMEKVNATFSEAAARQIFEEDELSSESDQSEEEDAYEREMVEEFRKLAGEELDNAVQGMDSNTNTDWSGSFTYPHER